MCVVAIRTGMLPSVFASANMREVSLFSLCMCARTCLCTYVLHDLCVCVRREEKQRSRKSLRAPQMAEGKVGSARGDGQKSLVKEKRQ